MLHIRYQTAQRPRPNSSPVHPYYVPSEAPFCFGGWGFDLNCGDLSISLCLINLATVQLDEESSFDPNVES
jgi:hypothetical protein